MTILHRIKFWIAKQRGKVAKIKGVQVTNLSLSVEEQKKTLEEQFLIEKDPLKQEEISRQYAQLEAKDKTWQKTKT